MTLTPITKKYRLAATILLLVSILLNILPLGYYTVDALINAEFIMDQVKLCMTVFVVLIMSIVSWVNKTTSRSKIWVIIIGLYLCLDNFLVPLLLIGITQIADEWFVNPLHKSFRNKYIINKQIDRRG